MSQTNQKFLYAWRILVILLLNLVMIALLLRLGEGGDLYTALMLSGEEEAVTTLSKIGSQGEEVRQIQKQLKAHGYDPGKIDGIFGERTLKALRSFQKAKGLKVDGIAGPATLKALGVSQQGYGQFSSGDISLLARVVSAESRGEPYAGQVAVAAVILNRIEHPSFPNTLAGVIYQPGAFSCLNDGGINAPVADSAYSAVRDAINGWDPSGGAVYYYNPAKSTNKWIFSRPVITVIGVHRFCA